MNVARGGLQKMCQWHKLKGRVEKVENESALGGQDFVFDFTTLAGLLGLRK
jgi:hypothetical protein